MDDLKEKLIQYKEITEQIITSVKEEQEEAFVKLLTQKQALINLIDASNYESDEFRKVSSELKLLEQDQILIRLIEEKKKFIQQEIKKSKDKSNALIAYSRNFNGYNLINKKI
ncbi:hypothetical protein [Clostridium fungisolvens]|uniref:Flagellar protein FliT n=1 Tax=Clostridium fungisolvens TaxID=1604897 RepID=A0A6V8SK24_9CLOT|nr:hypothetical protein [Clostridium fungisolvens]GFP77116.1 hypothetical protein bsdtw1_03230 [Clostridium fungisolvens]